MSVGNNVCRPNGFRANGVALTTMTPTTKWILSPLLPFRGRFDKTLKKNIVVTFTNFSRQRSTFASMVGSSTSESPKGPKVLNFRLGCGFFYKCKLQEKRFIMLVNVEKQ